MNNLFNKAVLGLGGELDPVIIPKGNLRSMLDNLISSNNDLIDIINKQEQKQRVGTEFIGDIYIGYIDNDNINAIAFSENDKEFVGLYFGLISNINILSFSLFGCSDFLKRTFPTEKEKLTINEIRDTLHIVVNAKHVPSKIRGLEPEDWQRAKYSSYVTKLCHVLISFHEIGHIVSGHLLHPILCNSNKEFKICERFEDDEFISKNLELLQALEFDADAYAIGLILGFALKDKDKFFLLDDLNIQEVAALFCLAICLLFHLLDVYSSNGQLKSSNTHPVPSVRLEHAFAVMCGYLEKVEPELLKDLPMIFAKCYIDIAEFWYICGFPRKTFENDFESLGKEGSAIWRKQQELYSGSLRELSLKRRNYKLKISKDLSI